MYLYEGSMLDALAIHCQRFFVLITHPDKRTFTQLTHGRELNIATLHAYYI
jgi:hypothetical protein